MPVPRPAVSLPGMPAMAERQAAAAVVLPMPISPAPSRSTPSAAAWRATSTPTRTADSASSRLIAASTAMLPVPGRTFRSRNLADSVSRHEDMSPATPTSTTTNSTPWCRANTLTAAPPARKLNTICTVTALG